MAIGLQGKDREHTRPNPETLKTQFKVSQVAFFPVEKLRSSHSTALQIVHAILVIEKVTYTLVKLSVLFLYRRIFSVDRAFRRANQILIVLVVLWGLSFMFLEAFLCETTGTHYQWCAPQEKALLAFAVTDVAGDIAILSLPYPSIRKLQVSTRDRIGIIATFALGTL